MLLVVRHVLESTFLCLLLVAVARWCTKSAAVRHAIGLIAVVQFIVPTVLLAPTGARLAFVWPAGPWLSPLLTNISAVLSALEARLRASVAVEHAWMFVGAWAAGTVCMVSCWLVRLRRGRPTVKPATTAEERALRDAMQSIPTSFRVGIVCVGSGQGPALQGICRASILIPAGLSNELTAAELRTVLLHELAHAKRLDNLAAVAIHIVRCVFWFHPLLWVAERWLQNERERACDELVLASGASRRVYAAGILKVCKFDLLGAAAGVSAMTGADLRRRLERILNPEREASNVTVPGLLVAVLLALTTLVPVAGGYCSQCVSNGQQVAATPMQARIAR